MTTITVQALVQAPLAVVWDCWTQPSHITKWNFASPDWHCPSATNDLQAGGAFHYQMAARDGSFSFDFNGIYDTVEPMRSLSYHIEDGRSVTVSFESTPEGIQVTEVFEPESENSQELQAAGWQAILDNFRNYVHSL